MEVGKCNDCKHWSDPEILRVDMFDGCGVCGFYDELKQAFPSLKKHPARLITPRFFGCVGFSQRKE